MFDLVHFIEREREREMTKTTSYFYFFEQTWRLIVASCSSWTIAAPDPNVVSITYGAMATSLLRNLLIGVAWRVFDLLKFEVLESSKSR